MNLLLKAKGPRLNSKSLSGKKSVRMQPFEN
jgi:hypothetical protein